MSKRSAGKTQRSEQVVAAAQRILIAQFDIFKHARSAFLEKRDPEALHDMRVSLNRFRQALRLFRAFLCDTSAELVQDDLSRFRSRLGLARDLEVWTRFLESRPVRTLCDTARGWQRYVAVQQAACQRQRRGLSRLLQGARYQQLVDKAEHFLYVELPRLLDYSPGGPYETFVAQKLQRGYKRILTQETDLRRLSPAEMHGLRLRCKRLRYWAEFAATTLNPSVRRLARRFKDVTQAFGDVHDMDVNLNRPSAPASPRPTVLTQHLRTTRKKALKESRSVWRALREKALRKSVMRALLPRKGKKK